MKRSYCFLAALLFLSIAGAVSADPCLVVYPSGPCMYHYDINEYYTVGPGHPYYDAEYDRGGYVLLELGSNEIDGSIYQAPMIEGFTPSNDGNEGYFFIGTDYELIVDGFSNTPTTFVNVIVVFDDFVPAGCAADIMVNWMPITGNRYSLGNLAVSTPTPNGMNYSDTVTIAIDWRGCYGVHIWAFADEDYSGTHDGGECFTAFSHDSSIATEESTWGGIKALFDE